MEPPENGKPARKPQGSGDLAGHAAADTLEGFVGDLLKAAGSAVAPAETVAACLTEASARGVDSHGVRLVAHYAKVIRTGRINPDPAVTIRRSGPGVAVVDADNGFGHFASTVAIDEGIALARTTGVAAVSVINSSHFGAAGCYAARAARAGFVGLAFSNSDSIVLPHDGLRPFHGTNPLAFAAPVTGQRPYLVDMATSIVPWNRVQDLLAKEKMLPADVAVDAAGASTEDPSRAAALLPLGGHRFGYKGAALASMMEIVSAVMTGMPHCGQLLAMAGDDLATPRRLGHFFLVIDPERFVSRSLYDAGMAMYLADLRGQAAQPGTRVMAPGDREWQVEDERRRTGIPIGTALGRTFDGLADELGTGRLDYL